MPVDTTNKPKMSEGRKSSKPLMEKRRRARINDSLCQLKSLILEATNKDTSRHSKLEKADILEMTVKYLRNMQRHQISGTGNPDPAMLNRYRLGYSECINEVSRYLDTSEPATRLRTQLIGHLANCCSIPTTTASPTHHQPQQTMAYTPTPTHQQPQQTMAYTPAPTPAPIVATAAMGPPPTSQAIQVQMAPSPTTTALPTKVEMTSPNVATRVVSGIPVANVPGAITTGEITVVLPPQAFQGGQLPSHFIPVYAQSAPSMLSPASSTSSQCLASPTSSVETPTTPTQQISYQYQPYEQQQQSAAAPQTVSYLPAGVATSPLIGSAAQVPTPTVQAPPPTLVAMPANVLTHAVEPITAPQQQQQHHMAVSQSHIYHQSPQKTMLRTVNINVQQQCATEDENVWRPW